MNTLPSLNVLMIGNGGREHALCHYIYRSPYLNKLFAINPNPGIKPLVTSLDDKAAIKDLCQEHHIDLVVIGPEDPLCNGLVDALTAHGILCFGPKQICAQLEGSKVFMKMIAEALNIPTAIFKTFNDFDSAKTYIDTYNTFPIVIKTDGLAAGKGVCVAYTQDQAHAFLTSVMLDKRFGASGTNIIVEEFLEGPEISYFALLDGNTILPFTSAQDHKRLLDGDQGPNTGGMGTISPAPHCAATDETLIIDTFFTPLHEYFKQQGTPYIGCLFAGLIKTKHGYKLLEYNVRFGDPETQSMLPRLKSDLLELLYRTAKGTLSSMVPIEWHKEPTVNIVVAQKNYPDKPLKETPITRLPQEGLLFQASTTEKEGTLYAKGGRVLSLCASGKTYHLAALKAYECLATLKWDDAHYRRDIGLEKLAEGKTKILYKGDHETRLFVRNKDVLTANDALKQDHIAKIGQLKNRQNALIMGFLQKHNIKTAFLRQMDATSFYMNDCDMLPIEWIARRYAWGSYLKRHPHYNHTTPHRFETLILEQFHKQAIITPPLVETAILTSENEARNTFKTNPLYTTHVFTDPLIIPQNASWALHAAKAPLPSPTLLHIPPAISEKDRHDIISNLIIPTFLCLEQQLQTASTPITLVDLKLEVGFDKANQCWCLADVIDNDSWRIWPEANPHLQLDKQAYRDGGTIDNVLQLYQQVTEICEACFG